MATDIDRGFGGPFIGSARGLSDDEQGHFYTCPACGQAVDMRDLGAVLHHEDPGHQPLPDDVAGRVASATAMLHHTFDREG